jgi:predicted RNase H-like HicB family nuclease
MAIPLFTARAKWDGEWWVIIVSDVPEALTHVRDRDDAAARIREAIALSLDIPQGSFNVQVDFDVMVDPSLRSSGASRNAPGTVEKSPGAFGHQPSGGRGATGPPYGSAG